MKISVLLVFGLLLLRTVQAQVIYYVSTTGSNSNPGTSLTTPFLTIQKAASLMVAGDTCYIRAGTYRETIIPTNSGTSTAPISFAPYSGETVIISGADVLNLSWTPYSGSIYRAVTTNSFRQLFVDGNMMNEARWPNAQVNDLLNAPRATVQSGTSDGLSLTDSALPNVDLVGATVHLFPGVPGGEWSAFTRQITAYDTATKTISWSSPTPSPYYLATAGNPYYVYGNLSLLDAPTEWYLDTPGSLLYLWTPDDTSPAVHTIESKARTEAFVLNNKAYITVSGFYIFAAGISMLNTTNCVVDSCHLRYIRHDTTADWGIWNSSPSPTACGVSGSGSVWQNSSITYSSQDGIKLEGGTGAMVTNCVIRNVDYYPGSYYSAVTAYGTNHKIIGNTMTDSGRYLVWHPAVTNNEIAYNDMRRGERLTRDGGATYGYQASGGGTQIHHNWASDSERGIYLDNGSSDFVVFKNVCWGNERGIFLNTPSVNNLVYNNTLVQNIQSISTTTNPSDQTGTRIVNNLADGILMFGTLVPPYTNKNGWFPPVGGDFVPQSGSGAIDAGDFLPPYTDGYVGTAPDIGAYEAGTPYWTPGATIAVPPFPGYGIPAGPTGLSAKFGDAQVILSWAEPTGSASYNVKQATVSGGPYTTIATGVTSTTYTDSCLVNGTTYYYVLSAVNSAGEGANSAETCATPTIPVIVDNGDPTGVTVTGAWSTGIAIPEYYGANYLQDGNTGHTGGKSVRFTPILPATDNYEVYLNWVPSSLYASNAPVDVNHALGTTTLSINQRIPGAWVLLGTFSFNAGTTGNVLIRNDGADGSVIADAVKFVRVYAGAP